MDEFARQIEAFKRRRDSLTTVIDSLVSDVKSLTKSVTKTTRTLQQIPTDFPKTGSRSALNPIKRTKSAIIKDTESFTTLWNQLATKYLSSPAGIPDAVKSITDIYKVQLVKAKANYIDLFQKAVAKYDKIIATHKEQIDLSAKARQRYTALCAKIEDAKKRQDYEKLGELKDKYIETCKQAETGRLELNYARIDFSTDIQSILSELEEAECSLVTNLNDILCQFAAAFESGATAGNAAQAEFESTLRSCSSRPHNDLGTFVTDNDCSPIATGRETPIRFSPEQLPFDIFEFVPPQVLFEEDLAERRLGKTRTKLNTSDKLRTIEPGTEIFITKVLPDKKCECVLLSGGTPMTVPQTSVAVGPKVRRKIFRLTEDFEDKQTKIEKGQYVVGIRKVDVDKVPHIMCVDAYHRTVHIPKSKLFQFQK